MARHFFRWQDIFFRWQDIFFRWQDIFFRWQDMVLGLSCCALLTLLRYMNRFLISSSIIDTLLSNSLDPNSYLECVNFGTPSPEKVHQKVRKLTTKLAKIGPNFVFSVQKRAPAWKKYTTADGGGGDSYLNDHYPNTLAIVEFSSSFPLVYCVRYLASGMHCNIFARSKHYWLFATFPKLHTFRMETPEIKIERQLNTFIQKKLFNMERQSNSSE